MTGIRTDLAQEAHQLHRDVEGVECRDETCHGYEAHVVQVRTPQAAQVLGKPIGTYVTVELDGLLRREEAGFSRAVEAVAGLLTPMLPQEGLALVVGLGNRAMTPDLVGPRAVDFTLVTRHLVEALPQFSHLRAVAALAAGVLGTTGVESGVLVQAVVDKLHPSCVIAVDALASRSVERLCRTVQLSDVGIVPGSGVGNHRYALSRDTLGVPVLSLGVPTVVDGATLIQDLLGERAPEEIPGRDLFVTPREADSRVADLSRVLGYAVSLALNPSLSVEELNMLVE